MLHERRGAEPHRLPMLHMPAADNSVRSSQAVGPLIRVPPHQAVMTKEVNQTLTRPDERQRPPEPLPLKSVPVVLLLVVRRAAIDRDAPGLIVRPEGPFKELPQILVGVSSCEEHIILSHHEGVRVGVEDEEFLQREIEVRPAARDDAPLSERE